MLGVAFSPYLVNHFPLLLIAISPLGRHLLLVAPIVDPLAFLLVAVVRRMAFYVASFHLGRALGPSAVEWIESRSRHFGRFVRWIEQLFGLAPRVVVLLMAGPTVSILAGISGMRGVVFGALATLSISLRAVAILLFAEWLRVYIELVLAWIDEVWVPATVVMVASVLVYRWRRRTPFSGMED